NLGGYGQLNEVSTIWFERNILLRNTIWPRRAYLEVLGFRTKDGFKQDISIPRDTAPPALRVRASKYVVADGASAEGWRLLTWKDVSDRPDLFGEGDTPLAPDDWKPRDPDVGLTVDEVELQLNKFDVRKQPPGTDLEEGWYLPSASAEEGWRPLLWSDLTP